MQNPRMRIGLLYSELMNSAYLIEGCPSLTIGSVKRDLGRCRMKEADITGAINIVHGAVILTVDYWFEYIDNNAFFVISVDGHAPQRILLSEQELYFGTRNYFVCDCGKRVHKLYLPPGKAEFRCRSCYKLIYELSTINRNSTHGRLLYIANRTIKLANRRADMSRIIYKSRYTKKYKRFLRLCEKAGLNNVVKDARDLMAAIKT